MSTVPQLIKCKVVGDTRVQLRFRDGWEGQLDLSGALRGPVFKELNRPEKFREVSVTGGTLTWPNGADICPSVLRYWCEIGRVCSQQELDEHFTANTPVAKVAETSSTCTRKHRRGR